MVIRQSPDKQVIINEILERKITGHLLADIAFLVERHLESEPEDEQARR